MDKGRAKRLRVLPKFNGEQPGSKPGRMRVRIPPEAPNEEREKNMT